MFRKNKTNMNLKLNEPQTNSGELWMKRQLHWTQTSSVVEFDCSLMLNCGSFFEFKMVCNCLFEGLSEFVEFALSSLKFLLSILAISNSIVLVDGQIRAKLKQMF